MATRDILWIEDMLNNTVPECRAEVYRHRADTIYILVMGGRIIAMQTGFAMLESAFARPMNAANIMMKNTMDLLLGAVVYYIFGWQIAFGEQANLGEERPFDFALWFCHFAYATTAATIVSGALAGRVSFHSYLMLSLILTGIIYPIVVRWTWGGGWLHELGYIDFAGSTIVHMIGSISALVSVCICGPRIGRFPQYQPWRGIWKRLFVEQHPASFYHMPVDSFEKAIYSGIKDVNNPVQCLFGTFLLLNGFLAFNPGSTFSTTRGDDIIAARTTVTTLLTVAGAPLGCWTMSLLRKRTWVISVPELATAIVATLVSSSACCNVVPPLVAILVGFVATLLALTTQYLCFRAHLDDVVGAVAAHGPPGAWGALCVPIWARPHCKSDLEGIIFGGGSKAWELLGIQVVGIVALAAFAAITTWVSVVLIDLLFGFRCSRAVELIGLDFMEHEYDERKIAEDPDKAHVVSQSAVRDCLKARLVERLSPQKAYTTRPAPPPAASGEQPKPSGKDKEASAPAAERPQDPATTELAQEVARLEGALALMAEQLEILMAPQGNAAIPVSTAPGGTRTLALRRLMEQAAQQATDRGQQERRDPSEQQSTAI